MDHLWSFSVSGQTSKRLLSDGQLVTKEPVTFFIGDQPSAINELKRRGVLYAEATKRERPFRAYAFDETAGDTLVAFDIKDGQQ